MPKSKELMSQMTGFELTPKEGNLKTVKFRNGSFMDAARDF